MKKRLCIFSAVIIILALLVSGITYASYYATSELKVKITKVLSKPFYHTRYKMFAVKAEFTVTKVGRGDGHNPLHCKGWENRKFSKPIFFTKSSTVDKLLKGKIVNVKFKTISGQGFNPRTGRPEFITSSDFTVIE